MNERMDGDRFPFILESTLTVLGAGHFYLYSNLYRHRNCHNRSEGFRMSAPMKRARVDDAALGGSKPWVEKYRPKKLDDIESQKEVVQALRSCLSSGSNMPHLLFHGPPGTGKTSAILAIARELFGPDMMPHRVRELNASDDRGIAVVRDKVKKFVQGSAAAGTANKQQSDGKSYPCPPFKIIILDEADALTSDAQSAMRRMMEDFSDVTRFCILCNYISKIIDPIASRCAKFRFKPLSKESLAARIRAVSLSEGLSVSDQTVVALDRACRGDLRLAIMYLQSAAKAHGNNLESEDFVTVAGIVPMPVMNSYLSELLTGGFEQIYSATLRIVQDGFGALQVLEQLHEYLTSRECTLSSASRSVLSIKLCETEKRLLDKGDDFLQLLDLAVSFIGKK